MGMMSRNCPLCGGENEHCFACEGSNEVIVQDFAGFVRATETFSKWEKDSRLLEKLISHMQRGIASLKQVESPHYYDEAQATVRVCTNLLNLVEKWKQDL